MVESSFFCIAHASLVQQLLSPNYRESHRERIESERKEIQTNEKFTWTLFQYFFAYQSEQQRVTKSSSRTNKKKVKKKSWNKVTTQLERIFIESQYIPIVVFYHVDKKVYADD